MDEFLQTPLALIEKKNQLLKNKNQLYTTNPAIKMLTRFLR